MTVGWVLGWAVPEAWFAPLARAAAPGAEHRFFAAAPGALDEVVAAGALDWIVGYSLGSLLLLEQAPRLAGRKVALLAPIFAFAREEGLGGRVARTQVRQLARWLARDPAAALADFYRQAGLAIAAGETVLKAGGLQWGLERLAEARVAPPLPPGWRAWCGRQDPLLDADRLRALDAGVTLVEDADHHPGALLQAWKEAVQ